MCYHIFAFIAGFVLDLLIGDPHFIPHPVSPEQCDRSGWLSWLHAYPAGADRKIADAYG